MSHFSTEPSWQPGRGDFADVVRRAERRKRGRRLAAATAAAPVLVTAVALVMTTGAPPRATLAADQPSPTESSASPKPSPSESTASPLPSLPNLLPTSDPSPSVKPSPSPTEDPDQPSPKPSHPHGNPPGQSPHPKPSPPYTPPPDDPATYAYLAGAAPAQCSTAAADTDARFWCTVYAGPATVPAGTSVKLPFQVCRSATGLDGTLHKQHVDSAGWLKTVVNGAEPSNETSHWYWYAAAPPYEPLVTVKAGDCVQWTVAWNLVDDSGHELAPGRYTGKAAFIVQEQVNGPSSLEYSLEVTR